MKQADYVFHPPSGSNVPGKVDANPYVFYPPQELKKLFEREKDPNKRELMRKALKQWCRIYRYPGYPYYIAAKLRKLAHHLLRLAEINGPAINLPYYQDSQVPEGFEGILRNRLYSPYDNYDMARFDYTHQGERPERDTPVSEGGFLNRDEGVFETSYPPGFGGAVSGPGSGPDPIGLEYPFPPTGGNLGNF